MGSSSLLSCYISIFHLHMLFLITISQLYLPHSFSSAQPTRCHEEDRSALLQFKQSLVIDLCSSGDPYSSHPKLMSWKLNHSNNYDCCSWDGVECDENTGHVIGLHLSSSCLHGSINSTNTLFRLAHLQTLNLANNHFNYSPIPSEIGNLSSLTNLNLSQSAFRGQIPSAISKLFKLSSLDLSLNVDPYSDKGLELKNSNLRSLVQNLTSLKQLNLNYVYISTVPEIMGNLSSLTTLSLQHCRLYGKFPARIFQLENLQKLVLRDNEHLAGYLPEFHSSSPLKVLELSGTLLSGELPISIGNLGLLTDLILHECNFSGSIPSSIGNLTHLRQLLLYNNSLTGHIPHTLGNLTQLTKLELEYNDLHGQIPSSFSQLKNIVSLTVMSNDLTGIVRIDSFHMLRRLSILMLSYNSLWLTESCSSNITLAQLHTLSLASCNLNKFPEFLRGQHKLSWLELSANNIQGLVPKWVCNISRESMRALLLDHNSLTGFEQTPDHHVLPWFNVELLDLSKNKLQGSIPIPPPSIRVYVASTNMLTGEIAPHICNLSLLKVLDLSFNNLIGMLSPCFGNLSTSLQVLKVEGNNLHGTISLTCTERSNLRMIDLSQNKLQGQLPRSLANCSKLEFLHIGSNQITDGFPSWMGILPQLKVLVLHQNHFYGAIPWSTSPKTKYTIFFPNLRILDLSHNTFSGNLPSAYLQQLIAMKITNDAKQLEYLQVDVQGDGWGTEVPFSMNITNKGTEMAYDNIQSFFKIIDLSSNMFEGEIPESIGGLKGLNLLNLSHNVLTGRIPSSLGDLKNLETLDLSENKLSGEIPPPLAALTFIGSFSVSNNNLTGPIPSGTQFSTFSYKSFEGNSGLCGNPLPNKCVFQTSLPPPTLIDESERSLFDFGWEVVLMGYGCGFVIGIVGGKVVINKKIIGL